MQHLHSPELGHVPSAALHTVPTGISSHLRFTKLTLCAILSSQHLLINSFMNAQMNIAPVRTFRLKKETQSRPFLGPLPDLAQHHASRLSRAIDVP